MINIYEVKPFIGKFPLVWNHLAMVAGGREHPQLQSLREVYAWAQDELSECLRPAYMDCLHTNASAQTTKDAYHLVEQFEQAIGYLSSEGITPCLLPWDDLRQKSQFAFRVDLMVILPGTQPTHWRPIAAFEDHTEAVEYARERTEGIVRVRIVSGDTWEIID